jgi:glycosyltransferase involved in cell wall biosynthesis
MLTHSFYESDNRVIRYAQALAERGDVVRVAALGRSPQQARVELMNGVELHRIQDRLDKGSDSAWSYLSPLLRFTCRGAAWLARCRSQAPIDVVHVHNIPDFLVFAALPSKLRGARVILDIHDIVPEFFASKFGRGADSMLVRSLRAMERASAAVADHVILANHIWLDRYAQRNAAAGKCSVVINHVDEQLFEPAPPRASCDDTPLILFPGGLQKHQGLDIAIRAFARLRERIPGARFHIYGDGNCKAELMAQAVSLKLGEALRFFDPLPLRDIARVMARADLAVVPKRADSFGNEAYSTKIMEFMALGVPVVASSTLVDRRYFDDSVLRFFESGNDEALAQAMIEVLGNAPRRQAMVARAAEYARRNSWSLHKQGYLDIIDALQSKPAAPLPLADRS